MQKVTVAREFALRAHGSQMYGDRPYSYHLDSVASIAKPYGETAQIIAYLHDAVEDTDCTLEEIKTIFGDLVSRCIVILTDESGENRKARKRKTYEKMAKVSGDETIALLVKAADRLANYKESVDDNNLRLIDIYSAEHDVFKEAAYRPGLCDNIWVSLDALVEGRKTQ